MNRLPIIQADFQRYVIDGGDSAASHIVGTDAASAEERLDVYYQAYRLRLQEVLQTDFAGLASLVTADEFRSLATGYIDAWPSTNPSVRWFGRQLPAFLRDTAPWSDRPELADMARLEWIRGRAFDAADASVLDPEELASVPPENWAGLQLQFLPSVDQLTLQWNVPAIWLAVSSDATPPMPERYPEPIGWLIWRRQLIVHWRSMEAAESSALGICRAGGDFAAMCADLCQWHDESTVPTVAAGMLKRWVTDELVVSVE